MKYDVVVVGSGILGISCAYHLKRQNPDLSVIVIDQNPRGGMGNTSKSAALFRNVFSSPVNRILASASLAFYEKLQKEEKIDLGLRYTGYLWLCDDALLRQFRLISEKEGQVVKKGYYPELKFDLNDISLDSLKELFGVDTAEKTVSFGEGESLKLPAISHGIFAPDCGTMSPSKLFDYYEKQFVKMGGELLYRTKVEKLLLSHAGSEDDFGADNHANNNNKYDYGMEENIRFTGLKTIDGVVKCSRVCLAAGTWTNFLTDPIGIDSHIKPKKRQLFNITIDATRHPMGYANKEERFPIFILPPDGIYVKPLRMRGNFIIGWADDLGRAFGFEDEPVAEPDFFVKYINPILTAYLPWLEGAELKHSWAGQYHYNTLDGNPYIFNRKNLTVVAGASGSGIMKADAIGKIAAAKILGNDKPDLLDGVDFPVDALGFENRLVVLEKLII